MKIRKYGYLYLMLITILLIAGCGKKGNAQKEYDGNALIMSEEGKLTVIVKSSFEKDYYDSKELESYVNDEIYQYNYKQVENAITVNSVKVQGTEAQVSLTYKNYKAYEGLNEKQKLYAGSVSGAMKEGYLFDTAFINAKKEEVSVADVTAAKDSQIVVLSQAMEVEVPTDIMYVSSNVEITGKKTATAPAEGTSYIIYK